ncbi:DNA-binding transcriptional LysR family regulator [Neorhizobium galegae]|uniref:LysR family transcriptional regulator n=1 Tax=Neorhizobium galegae TaxID=399 RepID=UPI001AE801DA|nr:LysR family transcriptional regulator [Neorhizobium galegae]MBP2547129.1 DNA-binding transcriptional LysR family regulator [Neorhizobium galegae]
MSNDLTLLSLRLFVDLAATASFSATARRHSLPPSSVSRHISGLEELLGQRLLFRNTRAVTLTDAGSAYLREVREALSQIDLASEQARGAAGEARGLLRINAPVAFGRRHIAPLLSAYQALHPRVEVDLTLSDTFIDPVAEGADITIRIGQMKDSSLSGRKLTPQRYVVCASPAYLARHGAPQGQDALSDHNCLLYKGINGAQKWYFRTATGGGELRPCLVRGNLTSNNADSLVEAALQHQGLVLFPTWLVHEHLASGRLVPVMTDVEAAVDTSIHDIHLIYPENRLRSFKVLSFRDYLLGRIGTPPYWDHPVAPAP